MNKKEFTPWFLLIPCILIMVIFVIYPVARTFIFSLYRYKLTEPQSIQFIGIENYLQVLKDPDFYYALFNSMIVLILVLVFSLIGSLFVGLLLHIPTKISPVLTAIAIIPWALPPLVNGIFWKFIFHPDTGLINRIFLYFHLIDQPIAWTNNRFLLLTIVSFVVSWRIVPFCGIIILANLQNIPNELYEAAQVDGATVIQRFTRITCPLLLPSLSILLIQMTMAAINVFDEIIALSSYRFESMTLLIYNYLNTFSYLDFGFGSAITYIITLLSGILGYFYIKSLGKEITR